MSRSQRTIEQLSRVLDHAEDGVKILLGRRHVSILAAGHPRCNTIRVRRGREQIVSFRRVSSASRPIDSRTGQAPVSPR
jgi:hypothetical protein